MVFASETDRVWDIGYISGTFDLFHVGHVNLLRRSKERCNKLIVGVLSDEAVFMNKNKWPVYPLKDRMAIIAALKYTDDVDETTMELLNKINAWEKYRFNAMFSGDDHANAGWANEERELKKRGAELVFFPYTQGISTTLLRSEMNITTEKIV
jgi:cytidyltransferase-like protein